MSLKREFVMQAMKSEISMRSLCRRYGVSPSTGYKWLKRFIREGEKGLDERSRRPLSSPERTSASIEELIAAQRLAHPAWGGRKIKRRLEDLGHDGIPAASTITSILKRLGLIEPRDMSDRGPWQRFEHEEPNALLQMDFKGHFLSGDVRCHPLTLLDDHSRYLLLLEACADERTETVKEHLTNAFRRYGLPASILTDNGSPWVQASSERNLTRLEIWLIRLGVKMKRSRVYHPQTMGKDERLHRSLKAEVIRGRTFRNLDECQAAFDEWRYVYNHQRPHEALEMGVPAERYRMSRKEFPETMPDIEYSSNDFVRKVQKDGQFHFKGKQYWVGQSLRGLPVAVRPAINDGCFDVYFCSRKLTEINLHSSSPMGEDEC